MVKRLIFVILLLLAGVCSAGAGTGPQDISKTKHNLSSSGSSFYVAFNEDQVCIFCHTPHGGTLDAPLWNRDLSSLTGTGVFTHYDSVTMSGLQGASNREVNKESLICLSCHDGSISVGDSLINNSGVVPDNSAGVEIISFGGYPGARIGGSIADAFSTGDLSDDHPISVSYTAVLGSANHGLQPDGTPEAAGLRLFGGAAKNVECATCHDPHVDYSVATGDPLYAPFLAIPNSNSDMCLACHDK